jgi:hypothetical protein
MNFMASFRKNFDTSFKSNLQIKGARSTHMFLHSGFLSAGVDQGDLAGVSNKIAQHIYNISDNIG